MPRTCGVPNGLGGGGTFWLARIAAAGRSNLDGVEVALADDVRAAGGAGAAGKAWLPPMDAVDCVGALARMAAIFACRLVSNFSLASANGQSTKPDQPGFTLADKLSCRVQLYG